MRRRTVLAIALIIIFSVASSYAFLSRHAMRYYERSVIRNSENAGEEEALSVAEDFDYASTFGVNRFHQLSENSADRWPYTWANLIDAEVIEYYDERFENLQGTPKSIEFRYEANVYALSQIHVLYAPSRNGGIYDDSIRVLDMNGSLLFRSSNYSRPAWEMRFAYRDNSGYSQIQASEINFFFSRIYIVEMSLTYNEVWTSLAAFSVHAYQIIVVDADFRPVLLCVQSIGTIS